MAKISKEVGQLSENLRLVMECCIQLQKPTSYGSGTVGKNGLLIKLLDYLKYMYSSTSQMDSKICCVHNPQVD